MDLNAEEITLTGHAVSQGIARGRVAIWGLRWARPPKLLLPEPKRAAELSRLETAIAETIDEIRALKQSFQEEQQQQSQDEAKASKTDKPSSENVMADVLETHELLLQDLTIIDEVGRRIKDDGWAAEYAFFQVLQRYMEALRQLKDDYLAARAIDIEDVGSRVLAHLRGQGDTRRFAAQLDSQAILMAWDMVPSDAAQLAKHQIAGLVTQTGSPNSHTAIIARAVNLPTVMGVEGLLRHAVTGREVLVDGYQGKIIFNPSVETHAHYDKVAARKAEIQRELGELRNKPAESADGRKVVLSANLELEEEIERLGVSGAAGVGLYRTEFFFFEGSRVPSEEEQFERYSRIARESGEQGVIIRTFDIGADKLLPAELADELNNGAEPEENPALGWRGLRICLDREDLFKSQMRAILRAGAEGKVRIMFPMVSGIAELLRARALLDECLDELRQEGLAHDPHLEVGIMIEVPSAALLADQMAQYVDFFSIGTNDLAQYTMAADRTNQRVSRLHQVGHPAIVRLLHQVVEAAHRRGIWVGICGEAAADLELIPLLMGLDFDEFSVGVSQVAAVKAAIRRLRVEDCRKLAAQALEEETSAGVITASWALADRCYHELL